MPPKVLVNERMNRRGIWLLGNVARQHRGWTYDIASVPSEQQGM